MHTSSNRIEQGDKGQRLAVVAESLYLTNLLVLPGMLALAKAMAGQGWRYPLIGPRNTTGA